MAPNHHSWKKELFVTGTDKLPLTGWRQLWYGHTQLMQSTKKCSSINLWWRPALAEPENKLTPPNPALNRDRHECWEYLIMFHDDYNKAFIEGETANFNSIHIN